MNTLKPEEKKKNNDPEEKKKNNDIEYFLLIMIILGVACTIITKYMEIKKEKEQ